MGLGVGIPGGDKSQSSHPSVGEHPEPAQLCPHRLHSWIHPNGEERSVFQRSLSSGLLLGPGEVLEATGCSGSCDAEQGTSTGCSLCFRAIKHSGLLKGQKEPGATSCLSPALGQDTWEVMEGISWGQKDGDLQGGHHAGVS